MRIGETAVRDENGCVQWRCVGDKAVNRHVPRRPLIQCRSAPGYARAWQFLRGIMLQ